MAAEGTIAANASGGAVSAAASAGAASTAGVAAPAPKSGFRVIYSSDNHGNTAQFERVVAYAISERCDAVFIGGDVTPKCQYSRNRGLDYYTQMQALQREWLLGPFKRVMTRLREASIPAYFILGNGDVSANYDVWLAFEAESLVTMVDCRRVRVAEVCGVSYELVGLPYVPFSYSSMKDWEVHDLKTPTERLLPTSPYTAMVAAREPGDSYYTAGERNWPLQSVPQRTPADIRKHHAAPAWHAVGYAPKRGVTHSMESFLEAPVFRVPLPPAGSAESPAAATGSAAAGGAAAAAAESAAAVAPAGCCKSSPAAGTSTGAGGAAATSAPATTSSAMATARHVRTILMAHAPPFGTFADVCHAYPSASRADCTWCARAGRKELADDPHVHCGSVALRQYIDEARPWITLHGHIHECVHVSGKFLEPIMHKPLTAPAAAKPATVADGGAVASGPTAVAPADSATLVIASGNDPLYTTDGVRGGPRAEDPLGTDVWCVVFDLVDPAASAAYLRLV